MKVADKNLIERANQHIKETGITITTLATKINYSRPTLSQYLGGTYKSDCTEVEDKLTKYLSAESSENETEPETKQFAPQRIEFYPSRDAKNIIGVCTSCQNYVGLGIVVGKSGHGKTYTLIRFDCEETGDLNQEADMYKKLICDMGVPIPLSHLYKKFAIPQPEDGEEIAKPPAQTQQPTALPLKEIICKGGDKLVDAQAEIDNLTTAAIKKNKGVFDKMFAPVLELLEGETSLEDIKKRLEDDDFVAKLCERMEVSDFEELLQRAMVVADLRGRSIEDD